MREVRGDGCKGLGWIRQYGYNSMTESAMTSDRTTCLVSVRAVGHQYYHHDARFGKCLNRSAAKANHGLLRASQMRGKGSIMFVQ